MQQPSIGRIVHYVLPAHYSNGGQTRAAIITRAWQPIEHPQAPGMSNLRVILDGSNDLDISLSGDLWIGSVLYDEAGAPGTWHWPPREPVVTINVTPDTKTPARG